MVMVEKDQVGGREFFSIVVFMIATKATDMTTTTLFGDTQNASWMVIIGSFLMILPSFIALNSLLKKYQNKNLLEITHLAFGKWMTFLIGSMMFFIVLINTSLETRSYTDQLITMNFPKTPTFILYLLFLLICLWGAKKGWESICSVAWMIFPYITLALILLVFLLTKDIVFNRVFPLLGPGTWTILKTSFNYVSLFGDALIIAMMYPFVKDHKTYTKSLFGALAYSVLIMAALFLSYALLFDYQSVGKITYPFNEAIRLVSIGMVITNIETFFLTFWLLSVIVKFAVYIYLVSKVFGFVFHIEEFEHTLIPITILILLIGLLPENQVDNIFVLRKQMLSYGKYLMLSLPLFLLIVVKLKEAVKG
ncbi:GerAB/ArcD/ProY family transporter [Neobacillus niacini]|uniref:GerAB/ArcD/ProY family transporter n=1 Tax=Neobacillus niacini TaxID=86668 RepID=UPI003B021B95